MSNIQIGGSGMAVLGGIVIVILAFQNWNNLLANAGLFIFGLILLGLGLYSSKS